MTSSSESTKDSTETPREAILDVVAESAPLAVFPRMVGIVNLEKMLSAARGRVNDSHRVQQAVLEREAGVQTEMAAVENGEDVSNFSVAGDTHYHTSSKTTSEGLAAKIIPLALAATLGAGGVGAYYLLTKTDAVQQPYVDQDANWNLGLEVKNEP